MRLPAMNVIKKQTDGVTRFTGLDHRPKVKQTAFWDMRNMSGEKLPVMAARKKRRYLRTLRDPGGLFAHDSLCWVDGTGFFYDGERVGAVTEGQKQMVRMGAQVLIWPDAVYYNAQTGEFGQLGAKVYREEISCHICRADGEKYEDYTVSVEAPTEPTNGQYWIDTSETPTVMRDWSSAQGMWMSVPTVYVKIEGDGIGKPFSQYDGVTISGMEVENLNGSFYLVDRGDDWVIVTALLTEAHTQMAPITIERQIPEMDFVVELNNRLWGCSSKKHEIYASALGDPKNWNQFIGQATDSYAVTVGSAGDFTGAAAYMGHVFFFKEDCMHRIMGYKPANFEVATTDCRGVQKGSAKSLQLVNETMMHKSRKDVCRMGSSSPAGVSDALGDDVYTDAVAGGEHKRYHICMRDQEGCPHVFVHDTESGSWVKEDELDVMEFATVDGELYALCHNGELWCMTGGGEAYAGNDSHMEDEIEWMLDTGVIGIDDPYNRYLSRIQLYCNCEIGSKLIVEAKWDNVEDWREVYRAQKVMRQGMTIPYVPPRCRTIRLRLRGTGGFELYQIIKNTERGSDVYGA